MKLTPMKILAAGAALIVLANAVALTGVYLNRSGEPDSRVVLSQRELGMTWGWQADRDNSGMVLGLNWRVHDGDAVEKDCLSPPIWPCSDRGLPCRHRYR